MVYALPINILNGVSHHYTALYPPQVAAQKLSSISERISGDSLSSDYAIITDVSSDLDAINEIENSQSFKNLRNYVRRRRNQRQKDEITKLHEDFIASGGKTTLTDEPIAEILQALCQNNQLVERSVIVSSALFGNVDVGSLNQGISGFSESADQVMLMAALAVVTGKYNRSVIDIPKVLRSLDVETSEIRWKRIGVDWRRALILMQDPGNFKSGLEGYREFSKKWADGDMHKAFHLASALLGSHFKKLNWGSCIYLKEKHLDEVILILSQGIHSGQPRFNSSEGYREFARTKYGKGDMQRAYVIASAVLGENSRKLNWGRQIQLKVDEVDDVISLLRKDIDTDKPEFKGLAGYRTFAKSRYGRGSMKKAYQIASALLGEDFAKLEWGYEIHLKEKDLDDALTLLMSYLNSDGPNHKGINGYRNFAKTRFAGGEMSKAYQIASALMGKDFAKLNWGPQIILKEKDYDRVRDTLVQLDNADKLRGEAGFKLFRSKIPKYISALSAWINGSAILGLDKITFLAWPKSTRLSR